MGWRATAVDVFAQSRREYEFGIETIKGVARALGVHRRMVRDVLTSALPSQQKRSERARPSLRLVTPFIDEILQADWTAPRKQRHTAHRINGRILEEYPDTRSPRPRCGGTCGSARPHSGTAELGDLRPVLVHLGAAGPG
jgi:hypothetical protein